MFTSHHLVVKLTSLSNKKKILKAAQDKKSVTYNGKNMTSATDIHRDLAGQKGLA